MVKATWRSGINAYGRIGEYLLPGNAPGPEFLDGFVEGGETAAGCRRYRGGYRAVAVGCGSREKVGAWRRTRRQAEEDAAALVAADRTDEE
jgi:hypothetical protein